MQCVVQKVRQVHKTGKEVKAETQLGHYRDSNGSRQELEKPPIILGNVLSISDFMFLQDENLSMTKATFKAGNM